MPEGTLVNDRYMLEALPLARGGMGEVYSGRDIALDREVAVKLIRFSQSTPTEEMVRRFVRESRITARLQHPGVPAIYDVGEHDGWPYLVMQKIGGITVADLIAENGALPIGWAAAIAAQVCATLFAAHGACLIHRDLKPSNLMLDMDGAVKILDFGLAVAFDAAQFSTITSSGQSLGTPAYMAPEQVTATASGPKTDLYALGCTLHEMLTGQALFSGSSPYAVMSKQVHDRPQPIRELRSDVPSALETLLLELLEKNPQHRPSSAQVVYLRLLPFVIDLQALPEVLDPPSTPSPVRMYASVLSRVFATASSTTPEPQRAAKNTVWSTGNITGASTSWLPPIPTKPQPQTANGRFSPSQASNPPHPGWNPTPNPQPRPPAVFAMAPTNPAASPRWRLRHSLWLLFPILGSSCLGGVGLIYVGIRAHRPSWWIPGILYTAAGWLTFVVVGVSNQTSAASNWGVGGWLLVWVGSILHSALINPSWLRWRVHQQPWFTQPAARHPGTFGRAHPSAPPGSPANPHHIPAPIPITRTRDAQRGKPIGADQRSE